MSAPGRMIPEAEVDVGLVDVDEELAIAMPERMVGASSSSAPQAPIPQAEHKPESTGPAVESAIVERAAASAQIAESDAHSEAGPSSDDEWRNMFGEANYVW